MPTQATPFIDRKAVSAGFDKIASHYEESSFLEQVLCQHLMERLDFLALSPSAILDLGTSTGRGARQLATRYPQAKITGVDIAPNMIQRSQTLSAPDITYQVADIYQLSSPAAHYDLIFSNLLLPLIDAPLTVCRNIQQLLQPQGCFLFSTLGPDTFKEFRQAWQQVDNEAHVFPFLDMHDVGDILVQSGLVEPILDRHVLTITYDNLSKLLAEVKATGARNYIHSRSASCLGKKHFTDFLNAYPSDPEKKHFPVTIEVVYGLAWKGKPSFGQTLHGNEVHIPVEQLKQHGK